MRRCHHGTLLAVLAACWAAGSVAAAEREETLVVMLRGRHTHEEVSRMLSVPLRGCWDVVERRNAAALFPSDFALIRQSGLMRGIQTPTVVFSNALRSLTCGREIVDALARHPGVRYVSAERKVALRAKSMRPLVRSPLQRSAEGGRNSAVGTHVTELLGARRSWAQGRTGKGVRVAVFDTGLASSAVRHLMNVNERTDWTDENTLEDTIGHGTHVTAVIAGRSPGCPGIAPEAEVYSMRVFNRARVSYTSWFLDAFNYAMLKGVHLINLSIGGPDFMDRPFVDKVNEVSANGITVVSAVGNDGPAFGTTNNPADMPDVIGVGGLDSTGRSLAPYSSRGMTTWELPFGYGRMKPDVVTYSDKVWAAVGPKHATHCRALSGTSVAAPVTTGVLALLASGLDLANTTLSPALFKQLLAAGAERIPDGGMFEQGAGRVSLANSMQLIDSGFSGGVATIPEVVDMTECPYSWPYCSQPLYHTGQPVVVNITILNSYEVSSAFASEPVWLDGSYGGSPLDVSFEHPEILWPWSGWLAVRFRVRSPQTLGVVEGAVKFSLTNPDKRNASVTVPFRMSIVAAPSRERRLLWDQTHSVKYPPGFLPRDVLTGAGPSAEQFDWTGDHPHTNFRQLYEALRSEGYFVEVLADPFTCFNASLYGALLVVDPEDEFAQAEIEKIHADVTVGGMGLFVVADWYDQAVMDRLRFLDDNTKLWWTPATGGSNVPAINDILEPFGVAFGDEAYEGLVKLRPPREPIEFLSGNALVQFPNDPAGLIMGSTLTNVHQQIPKQVEGVIFFGAIATGAGRLAVLGDSSCLDSAVRKHNHRPQGVQHVTGGDGDGGLSEQVERSDQPSGLTLFLSAVDFITVREQLTSAFPGGVYPVKPRFAISSSRPKDKVARPPTGELQRLSALSLVPPGHCPSSDLKWVSASGALSVDFPRVRTAPSSDDVPPWAASDLRLRPPAWETQQSPGRSHFLAYAAMTVAAVAFITVLSVTRTRRQRNLAQ